VWLCIRLCIFLSLCVSSLIFVAKLMKSLCCLFVYALLQLLSFSVRNKDKAVPATGCGGPQCCETSRLSHLLDNQLTGKFLALLSVRGWVDFKAIIPSKGLDKLKKSNDLIVNRIYNLPTCNIVPHEKKFGDWYFQNFLWILWDNLLVCASVCPAIMRSVSYQIKVGN
jgi:hypothetical protein